MFPLLILENYIKETLDSILNQKYNNLETIVIDGLSEDYTLSILKQTKNIKFISEKDSGQSEALNKGFSICSGDILAWQNADDLYLKNTFKIIDDFFTKNKDIDFVYGRYSLIDSKSNIICSVNPPKWS